MIVFNLTNSVAPFLHPQTTRIKWGWEKVGLFQSFAEIEQLNAMVEPHNLL